jgi:hypothetical protein
VRSLGYAYIFETWPDTRPDGSSPTPASDEAAPADAVPTTGGAA